MLCIYLNHRSKIGSDKRQVHLPQNKNFTFPNFLI